MKLNTLKSIISASFVMLPMAVLADDTKEKEADLKVTVNGGDTMQFDNVAIDAVVGQTIEITFKNTGQLPKEAMGHNIVVLKPNTDVPQFALAAMAHKDTDFVPSDKKDLVIAASKVLGPGEEEVVTFTVQEAGEYPYICSFPGHYAIMKGVITVTAK